MRGRACLEIDRPCQAGLGGPRTKSTLLESGGARYVVQPRSRQFNRCTDSDESPPWTICAGQDLLFRTIAVFERRRPKGRRTDGAREDAGGLAHPFPKR